MICISALCRRTNRTYARGHLFPALQSTFPRTDQFDLRSFTKGDFWLHYNPNFLAGEPIEPMTKTSLARITVRISPRGLMGHGTSFLRGRITIPDGHIRRSSTARTF